MSSVLQSYVLDLCHIVFSLAHTCIIEQKNVEVISPCCDMNSQHESRSNNDLSSFVQTKV
jgi:hypothetical protein